MHQLLEFFVRCILKEGLWRILRCEPQRADQVLGVMMKGNGNSSRTEENLRRVKSVSSEASVKLSSSGDDRHITLCKWCVFSS